MRVLILGAAGFAGRYLTRELLERGHDVFAATKSGGREEVLPTGCTGEGRPDALPDLPLLRCDVTAQAEVEAALAATRPDGVVFLAGLSAPAAASADPAGAFAVHVSGVVHLLLAIAAGARPVRALVVTSSEVYGRFDPGELPLTESAALRPETIYGASKAAGDLAAAAIAAARDLDVVRLRPFNHTGPGQLRDFVCPDFAAQVAGIARGRRPPLVEVGNLDVRRDLCDVRDVVRGYALALERGRSGEAYNLCSGRSTSIREILELLCEIGGVRVDIRPVAARLRGGEVPAVFGNAAKAQADLGWQPEISLRRTLEDVLARAFEEETAAV